jgi:hypothetical protein
MAAIPANTAAPTISGSVNIGSTITVHRGTWSGVPTEHRCRLYYQNAAGTDKTLLYESYFTAATHTFVIPRTTALAGWYLRVEVAARNYLGARKAWSAGAHGPIVNPGGGIAISNFLPMARHRLKAAICTLAGSPISYVTDVDNNVSIWDNRDYEFHLGVARMVSGRLPSADSRVGGVYAPDGFTKLAKYRRSFKVWREERQQDGSYIWDCIFAGQIRAVEPAGDENGVSYSTFVAYDPLIKLGDVYVRAAGVGGSSTAIVSFAAARADVIIKTLIDRAQVTSGEMGIDTAGGVYDVTTARDASFQQQTLADAIGPFINAYQGCDIWLEPQDRTDGKHAQLNVYNKRYRDVSDQTIFAWATSPYTVEQFTNPQGDSPANDVSAIGSNASLVGQYQDAASKAAIGPFEVIEEYSDIGVQAMLDALSRGRVAFSAYGVDRVSFIPAAAVAATDYRNMWHVGDFVKFKTAAAAGPGSMDGLVRIYGVHISFDDDGTERVTEILTHPEALADPSLPAQVRRNDMSKQVAKLATRVGRLRRKVTGAGGDVIEMPYDSLPAGTYSYTCGLDAGITLKSALQGPVDDTGAAVAGFTITYQKRPAGGALGAVNGPGAAIPAALSLAKGDTMVFTTNKKATFSHEGRVGV